MKIKLLLIIGILRQQKKTLKFFFNSLLSLSCICMFLSEKGMAKSIHDTNSDSINYIAKLDVSRINNCEKSSFTEMAIVNTCASCQNLQFYFPDRVCVGEKVTFINSATGCSLDANFVWDFGDGSPVSGLSTHTFAQAGTNNVKLYIPVAGTCSEMNISKTVNVVLCSEFDCSDPVIKPCDGFNVLMSGTGNSPLDWSFTATVSGGASPFQYAWIVSSNLTISSGLNTAIIHTNTLNSAISYTVAVTVTDINNCTITREIVFRGTGI